MSRRRRERGPSPPLPPPLAPAERTVGQLVAETLRLYARRFWPSLALGLVPAAAGLGLAEIPKAGRFAFAFLVGSACLSLSYAQACALAAGTKLDRRAAATAVAVGVVVLAPVVFLLGLFGILALLPSVFWLAFVGMVVPALVLERKPVREAFRRATALARNDFVHAAGGLAALAVVSLLTAYVMFFLLRSGSQTALRAAAFASALVISPVLFLGSALLYFDQAAREGRLGSAPRQKRRRDADLHPALEADRPGRADPEIEPEPAP